VIVAKDFSTMEDSNPSPNVDIHAVSDPGRRRLVQGGLGALASRLLAPLAGAAALQGCASGAQGPAAQIGFSAVAASSADAVLVPPGYVAEAIYAWGDPVGLAAGMPAFRPDAGNSAAEQALQAGMHHDGMHLFPLAPDRGLLAMNHEYTDDGLLHADGMKTWSAEKVRKSQASHGVSVIEVARGADGRWLPVRPSRYARRITATTPMRLAGPAAGHPLLRTALDETGTRVLGTFNNCAHGVTPWGTYLTCEENFAGYFHGPAEPDAHGRRWNLRARGAGYRWHEHDERFDATRHPNEINRHGWIVEIDPFDPDSTPVKRTALGRGAHEGALVMVAPDGRAVVYTGEDARFEYIYKFVSRDRVRAGGYAANAELLDHGTLYVARFDDGGRGEWLELGVGRNGLDAASGFANAGDVLIKSRQASDRVGGTRMDRPEWIAGDPRSGTMWCALTNNSSRGQPGFPGVDAANPRANNTMGGVIRWTESAGLAGTRFDWDHFILAGDPANERAEAKGTVKGDPFGAPDGIWLDPRGILWIQTDASSSVMGKGDYTRLGNNTMLAVDPRTGECRRFLTGPVGCEVTGMVMTPDLKTLFINIQHPGETPSERSDPEQPARFSTWPQSLTQGSRPRSATVAIRKLDGGVIGS